MIPRRETSRGEEDSGQMLSRRGDAHPRECGGTALRVPITLHHPTLVEAAVARSRTRTTLWRLLLQSLLTLAPIASFPFAGLQRQERNRARRELVPSPQRGGGRDHPARAPLCAPPGSAQTLPTLSTPAFPCVTHASRLSAALTNEFQFLLSPKIATKMLGTSPVPGRRRALEGHSAGTVSSASCRLSPRGFKTKFKTNLPLGQAPSPLQANRQQWQH